MTGGVWYFGERGDFAAAYKIFGNSMLFTITAGIADVLAMAKNVGVSPTDAAGLFSKFRIRRHHSDARREDGPGRPERHVRADHGAEGHPPDDRSRRKQPLTVLPAVAARMDEAIAAGHGKDDMGAIALRSVQPAR